MIIYPKAHIVHFKIGRVGESIARKGHRWRERSQVSAGNARSAKIRKQIFTLCRPTASDLEFGPGSACPARLRLAKAAVFVCRSKGISEQRLVVQIGKCQAASCVKERLAGGNSNARTRREQPASFNG